MTPETVAENYEVELSSLPQYLNLQCRRNIIWHQLTSAVKKNTTALFRLGCMLGQIQHTKAYETLGCKTFADVCDRLGISDRRGRRLVNFALFTVETAAILGRTEPLPLGNVEFADRIFAARKRVARDDYEALVKAYAQAGCANDEIERQLKAMLKQLPLSGGNLQKYAEYHSKRFASAVAALADSPMADSAIAEFIHNLSPLQVKSHLTALRTVRQALTRV